MNHKQVVDKLFEESGVDSQDSFNVDTDDVKVKVRFTVEGSGYYERLEGLATGTLKGTPVMVELSYGIGPNGDTHMLTMRPKQPPRGDPFWDAESEGWDNNYEHLCSVIDNQPAFQEILNASIKYEDDTEQESDDGFDS